MTAPTLNDTPAPSYPESDTDRPESPADVMPELADRRERLVALYAGRDGLDEATVRARLDAVCRRLAGSRVRGYLPVLVERGLRESLGRA